MFIYTAEAVRYIGSLSLCRELYQNKRTQPKINMKTIIKMASAGDGSEAK